MPLKLRSGGADEKSTPCSRLPALEVSVLLLVEPALNPVWTWLVHGEVPGTVAIAGGALVLGATVVRALWPDQSP